MIELRKATNDDISFLKNLRVLSMKEHVLESGSKYKDEEQLQRIEYEFQHAAIVTKNNKDIGLFKVNKDNSPWDLIQIQIHPKFQGQGIGRELLSLLINEAVNKQVNIKLSVFKKNPALKLYLSVGFTIIDEGDKSFIMQYLSNII